MFAAQKLAALSTAAFLLAAATTPAAAAETTCKGKLGEVTVDDLRVPQNATCELHRTKVKGTITVQRGASLLATRVIVIGNVEAKGARSVSVGRMSRVGGSLKLLQGNRAVVVNSNIEGRVRLESNRGQLIIFRSSFGNDLKIYENTGGIEIEDNVIEGNLQCKRNKPAPIGGDNNVRGSKVDQCRSL